MKGHPIVMVWGGYTIGLIVCILALLAVNRLRGKKYNTFKVVSGCLVCLAVMVLFLLLLHSILFDANSPYFFLRGADFDGH